MTDNVRQGLRIEPPRRIYCGNKAVLPPGYGQFGNRLVCFRKGFAVGKIVQEKTFPERLRSRTQQVEAAVAGLTRQQLINEIQKKGLNVLKNELRLDQLNKDLVRSLAVRLTGTDQAIPRYSNLSKEQLILELVQRGFTR